MSQDLNFLNFFHLLTKNSWCLLERKNIFLLMQADAEDSENSKTWILFSEHYKIKIDVVVFIQKWTRFCQNTTLCTPCAHGAHLSELNNGVILPILLTLLFDIRTNVGCLGHHYILTICFCYIMYLQRS